MLNVNAKSHFLLPSYLVSFINSVSWIFFLINKNKYINGVIGLLQSNLYIQQDQQYEKKKQYNKTLFDYPLYYKENQTQCDKCLFFDYGTISLQYNAKFINSYIFVILFFFFYLLSNNSGGIYNAIQR